MITPRYEYSRAALQERVSYLKSLIAPYGLTVRYAMKANPYKDIIALLDENGVHFDASSSYEASELLALGIPGAHISLSSQQSAHNLPGLLTAGVQYVATSLHQLEQFVAQPNRPKTVAVRINPAVGHGHNNRTSTGGTTASFGIWHEYIPQVLKITNQADVAITRLHIHVGSGADPAVWGGVMDTALGVVRQLSEVTTLDIGGGYKVHRYDEEKEADMVAIMANFGEKLTAFFTETGRQLQLEIEPGTYLVAHCGTLVATVDDIVDTGKDGYTFLRLNTGMNDFLRSALYGANHRIEIETDETETQPYIVVGHNCESSDIFTPASGDPESLAPRLLPKAKIGDTVRLHDMGAYCASMRARGYNSFPEAIEVMVD